MNAKEQEIFQQMLAALKAFQEAKAMPSYGDYAAIAWESSAGPYNKAWGGGDCTKHGRWYSRCHSCEDDWKKLREQSDRDAVHARDNALRKADDLAKAAIAAAEALQAQQPSDGLVLDAWRDGWPTDDMVIRGAEQLHDSLRQFDCYHNFDADLNGTFVQQQVAESVFRAMLYAAQKPEGGE